MSDQTADEDGTFRSMFDLEGNEEGASSDGDSGPQGLHTNPKPGNHPELAPKTEQGTGGTPAMTGTPSPRKHPAAKQVPTKQVPTKQVPTKQPAAKQPAAKQPPVKQPPASPSSTRRSQGKH